MYIYFFLYYIHTFFIAHSHSQSQSRSWHIAGSAADREARLALGVLGAR